ncbi:three-Cys-motif partner protein TcmP [Bradyrhizobium sp. CCGB20]|uniref:three-Cys-motif partner protein TcmP n=1 Tax=Bradyrhizobium sp. CCGB20 TaxID=2949633 RepID=UPI0020B265C7|nr:three-Cys-motif partner protein TcmP [Bradyrhizobium sp. CCGB20]MCP3400234.1 three-Cys-motif partner protein TcmP [Bradyrhizobium sp. CCGB20]
MKRNQVDHTFGGYHTDLKLSMVEKYLIAFTKALGKATKATGVKFELWYIDAFAGTGYRTVDHPARPPGLFGVEAQPATKELRRGSAQIALEVTPKFDFLVFIEKKAEFAQELEELRARHPQRRIQVIHREANGALLDLLRADKWRSRRAVLFLDPYGMHVDWSTLKEVAATQAIDVWYLFPLAGFYRQMPKLHSKLDQQKRQALIRLFGTTSWEDVFYPKPVKMRTLDGDVREVRVRRAARISAYEKYTKERLETIFGTVLDPLRLPRTKGPVRYLLFLCVSSRKPRAQEIASRIGNHILKAGISS